MVKNGGPGHQLAGFLGDNPVDDPTSTKTANTAFLGVIRERLITSVCII
jgi:hypothetical protein